MTLLTRDAILNAQDLDSEDVSVPEWGGSVRVRALTGTERDAFEASMVQVRTDGSRQFRLENIRARLVALTVINEGGQRIFSDDDVRALGQKSGAALERVWAAARKLSALSDEDVEELAGDFAEGPSAEATSA